MSFYAFLKVEGIPGESTDSKHTNEIEVLSFNHHMSQAGGAATSRTGGHTGGTRADIGDFSITKVLDKASPNLAKYCASGKHIPSVVLSLSSPNDKAHTYMKYTLTNALVSGLRPGGSSSAEGTRPLEEVSFRFSKIEWEYTPFDDKGAAGGAIKAGWDMSKNEAV